MAREPDAETSADDEDEDDDDDDDDDADAGFDGAARGMEGSPGPSTTRGGGAVEGESVGGSEGATVRTSPGSAVSGSMRSVASYSATAAAYVNRRSAICTAFRAAPFRRLSATTNMLMAPGTAMSSRTRPT